MQNDAAACFQQIKRLHGVVNGCKFFQQNMAQVAILVMRKTLQHQEVRDIRSEASITGESFEFDFWRPDNRTHQICKGEALFEIKHKNHAAKHKFALPHEASEV